jgi:hypothetical protein
MPAAGNTSQVLQSNGHQRYSDDLWSVEHYTRLTDFLLMTHFSQSFLPLVCSHFMAFSFFTAGHPVFTSFEDVICFS